MKHSIRIKMTFLLTVMIVVCIFLTWLINQTFLSTFYMYTKVDTLQNTYNEIVNLYSNSSSAYLSDEETDLMERMESRSGVEISIFNARLRIIYPAPNNIGERQVAFLNKIIDYYLSPGSISYIEKKDAIKESMDYDIFTFYDRQSDSSYMDLVGFFYNPNNNATLGDGNGQAAEGDGDEDAAHNKPNSVIIIRSSVESIEDGAAISNEFLSYVGIGVVLLGSVVMYFISRRFTKPIHELADISKRMADLDFEVKYKVTTKDEVGELGSSINSLSDKLEATITELKSANNELLTDIQKKTELDEMRKEFLSNVSHELKTPIALIQGNAEALKENINDDPESRDFYCEVIMDEASKMNQMVKKLLSLNELEFGNSQVNFERFDIVTLIHSVLSSTEILFRQKEVTLHFDQPEPVYVWADEYLVEQVLTNYISNAINHVSGQKIIEVKLILQENKKVRVAVFNTGENIPEEALDKIWIKFYKVDKARTREYGGSGIGLSIVKAIMNSHNQECGVINRPVGVEFWFELDM